MFYIVANNVLLSVVVLQRYAPESNVEQEKDNHVHHLQPIVG